MLPTVEEQPWDSRDLDAKAVIKVQPAWHGVIVSPRAFVALAVVVCSLLVSGLARAQIGLRTSTIMFSVPSIPTT
jgi:hypothetical protein